MMELAVWIVLSFLSWHLMGFVCAIVHARAGKFFGGKVEYVLLGRALLTPFHFSWQGKDWVWRIALFPLGTATKFQDESDAGLLSPTDPAPTEQPSGSLASLSPVQRTLAVVSGHTALLVFGVFLLTIPVLFEADQLVLVQRSESEMFPVAVSGLKTQIQASTFDHQIEFVRNVTQSILSKYLLFQPLDGWGGWFGCVVTQGTAGRESWMAWLTCLGCLSCVYGIVNLLPIPGMSGFMVVTAVIEVFFGADFAEKIWNQFTLVALIFFLAVFIRLAVADWLWMLDMWH